MIISTHDGLKMYRYFVTTSFTTFAQLGCHFRGPNTDFGFKITNGAEKGSHGMEGGKRKKHHVHIDYHSWTP